MSQHTLSEVPHRSFFRSVKHVVHEWGKLIFPVRCLACAESIDSRDSPEENVFSASETGSRFDVDSVQILFCDDCLDKLLATSAEGCQRCGAPMGPYLKLKERGCNYCFKDPFLFQTVLRVGVYQDLMKQVCLKSKFGAGFVLARALADLLLVAEQEKFDTFEFDLIVPVPQHWQSRLLRSHNTAMVIAEELSTQLGLPLRHRLVFKQRKTPPQTSLSPKARRTNLRGAFQLRKRAKAVLQNQKVLLVDDVMTTGSTAQEICKVLFAGEVHSVVVAVISRGLGKPSVPK